MESCRRLNPVRVLAPWMSTPRNAAHLTTKLFSYLMIFVISKPISRHGRSGGVPCTSRPSEYGERKRVSALDSTTAARKRSEKTISLTPGKRTVVYPKDFCTTPLSYPRFLHFRPLKAKLHGRTWRANWAGWGSARRGNPTSAAAPAGHPTA